MTSTVDCASQESYVSVELEASATYAEETFESFHRRFVDVVLDASSSPSSDNLIIPVAARNAFSHFHRLSALWGHSHVGLILVM